ERKRLFLAVHRQALHRDPPLAKAGEGCFLQLLGNGGQVIVDDLVAVGGVNGHDRDPDVLGLGPRRRHEPATHGSNRPEEKRCPVHGTILPRRQLGYGLLARASGTIIGTPGLLSMLTPLVSMPSPPGPTILTTTTSPVAARSKRFGSGNRP